MRIVSATIGFFLLILAGCSTTTEQLEYSWDVFVLPEEANTYRFAANLTEIRHSRRETLTGVQESAHTTTWAAPSFIVKANEPQEMSLGNESEPDAFCANVLVEQNEGEAVVSYSVHVGNTTPAHKIQGRIQIRK